MPYTITGSETFLLFALVCCYFFEVEPLTSTSLFLPLHLHSSPPLPDGCPIRSTSRPVLANHTTSKPGGGVKKVTGVGGTTYEISVWVTDSLHSLSQGGGQKRHWTTSTSLVIELWILSTTAGSSEMTVFPLQRTDGAHPVWYSLCYLCNATGQSSLPAFQIWTKRNWGHWFIFHRIDLCPFSHFVSHRLVGLHHHEWVQICL